MRRTLMTALPACAAVLAVAVAGCGSSDGSDDAAGTRQNKGSATTKTTEPTPTPSVSTPPPAPTFDPPHVFDASAPVPMPSTMLQSNVAGAVTSQYSTLRGRELYIVTDSELSAVDVLTGKQKWKQPFPGAEPDPNAVDSPFVSDSGPRPPAISADGKQVVSVVPITIAGHGTTPSHTALSVLAVDLGSGQPAWSAKVDLPKDAVSMGTSEASFAVVSADERAVVVTFTAERTFTVALDPTSHQPLWQQPNFYAGAVVGDTVVGVDSELPANSSEVQGSARGLTDGKPKWYVGKHSSEMVVTSGGPKTVIVNYRDYRDNAPALAFVDASGTVLHTEKGMVGKGLFSEKLRYKGCLYDDRSVIVCYGNGGTRAFDTTGNQLWKLPEGGRVEPGMTALWHGVLYGGTSNGPVTLDARTGKDLPAEPGFDPTWVSEYAGIGVSEDGKPMAYPAKS